MGSLRNALYSGVTAIIATIALIPKALNTALECRGPEAAAPRRVGDERVKDESRKSNVALAKHKIT